MDYAESCGFNYTHLSSSIIVYFDPAEPIIKICMQCPITTFLCDKRSAWLDFNVVIFVDFLFCYLEVELRSVVS